MTEFHPSTRDVLESLKRSALITEAQGKAAEDFLATRQAEPAETQGVRLLTGCGAWLAAIFLLVFLGIAGLFIPKTALFFGCLLITIAVLVRRMNGTLFISQFCLAVSLAGHLAFFSGIVTAFRNSPSALVIPAFLLSLVLYFAYPDSTHRFLSIMATYLLLLATIFEFHAPGLLHLLTFFITLGVCVLFLHPSVGSAFASLGHNLALLLVITQFPVTFTEKNHVPAFVSSLILTVFLGIIAWWIAGNTSRFGAATLSISLLAIIVFGLVSNPGIMATIFLLVLGFALRDRTVTGIGIAFLPVFLVYFYYDLTLTLAIKSLVLVASGGVLLVIRAILLRTPVEAPIGGAA
jgi:hypothetical protein